MESVFITILNMSFQASFVIAAILAARLLLSRAPRIISYALWSAAWFRLICPFAIPVPFGIRAPIPADIGMQTVPRIDSGIAVLDNAVSSVLPAATPMVSANPMQIYLGIAQLFWQAGILVMLLWGIVSLLLFIRRLGDAQETSPGVYISARIDTPFVLGRRIYLPEGLGEMQREMILAHERTHLRRGDPIVKLAAFLVLARLEGILLDPVYTGKAWAGMLKLLRKGYFDGQDNILFVHTGGAAALFAMDLA